MTTLEELKQKINLESISSEETKVLIEEILTYVQQLEEENRQLKTKTRSVSQNPKPNIRRPGGDIHMIQDDVTKKAIVQLWEYKDELLKEQATLLERIK